MDKECNISIKNIVFLVFFAGILYFGIVLRTLAWINCIPFFYDEAALICNIINYPSFELFLPLDENQTCPPLFLLLTKGVYQFYGTDKFAIKIFPYIFSTLSVFLFGFFSLKFFKNKLCILTANLLFVTSEFIVLYTMFLKHYTCDVFFTILVIMLAYFIKDKSLSAKNLVCLSVASVIAILFSYTAAFIMACSFVAIFIYKELNSKEKNHTNAFFQTLKKSLFYLIPLLIFVLFYIKINCYEAIYNDVKQSFWGVDFATMFPKNLEQWNDLIYFLGGCIVNNFVTSCLFIISAVLLFKKDRFSYYIIIFPFILAAFLGWFKLYPFFAERICIYLIPLFFVAIVKPIDYLAIYLENIKNKKLSLLIITLCCLSIFNCLKIYKFFSQQENLTLSKIVQHNYDKRYSATKSVFAIEFLDFLKHSDYKKGDFIFCKYANYKTLELFDLNNIINYKHCCYFTKDLAEKVPIGSIIYFCISETNDDIYPSVDYWIKKHGKVLYTVPTYEYNFIKIKRIK